MERLVNHQSHSVEVCAKSECLITQPYVFKMTYCILGSMSAVAYTPILCHCQYRSELEDGSLSVGMFIGQKTRKRSLLSIEGRKEGKERERMRARVNLIVCTHDRIPHKHKHILIINSTLAFIISYAEV